MTINTFLFDLDGTLLPLNQDDFVKAYFKGLAIKFASLGFDPDQIIKAVWAGTEAMIRNTGEMTNEKKFWQVFSGLIKCDYQKLENDFTDFYNHDFEQVRPTSRLNQLARASIDVLKEKGYRMILSTNPIFPKVATYRRIAWAGLDPQDFEYITTYENSHFCKPNLKYYEGILQFLKARPDECMVVGNDALEDMCASRLKMQTYLLTDCLINSQNLNLDDYQKGTFEEFHEYVKVLPKA